MPKLGLFTYNRRYDTAVIALPVPDGWDDSKTVAAVQTKLDNIEKQSPLQKTIDCCVQGSGEGIYYHGCINDGDILENIDENNKYRKFCISIKEIIEVDNE